MKIKKIGIKFTYILHALVVFLGQFNLAYHFLSRYAYVDGYFVNYYDFVIHIVDVIFFLSLFVIIFIYQLWRNKSWLLLSVFSFALWIVHNLIFRDAIVFYWSARLFLYFISALSLHYSIANLKSKGKSVIDKYLVYSVSAALIIQSIIICVQFFTNRVVGLHFLGESVVQTGVSGTSAVVLSHGIYLRGYGTFPHPNVAGGFISVGMIYLISHLLSAKKKRRLLIIIPLVISSVGLFLTWSRSSWIFISVGTLFLLYKYFRRKRSSFARKGMGTLMVVLGVILIWFAASDDTVAVGLRDRIIKQSLSYDESVFQRNQLNQKAIEMYENNILTGVGAGKFIHRLSASPVYTADGLRIMQPAHNVFVLAAAELGFMALWIFSYFLYHTLKGLRRNYYLFFPLLFIFIVGNLDHYPMTVPQGLLLMVILDWLVVMGESIDS
jgi:hypothetical protein